MNRFRSVLPLLTFVAVACASGAPPVAAPAPAGAPDAKMVAKAHAIHDRVLSIDTHVDISPAQFRVGMPNYATDLPGRQQVDLVKMEKGGLGGAFLIAYVGQSTDLTPASFARANSGAREVRRGAPPRRFNRADARGAGADRG